MSGAASSSAERRGPVLDVLKELLAEGRNDEALAVIEKLVARNNELERRLAEIGSQRKKNEGISKAQLLLFLDALATAADSEGRTDEERDEANRKLRNAAGIDRAPLIAQVGKLIHRGQLTSTELALFIEGCELVGRRTLSPSIVKPKVLALTRAV